MPDASAWNWKTKDGTANGLLYESGNWGDLVKVLWLVAILGWKKGAGNYFDPFAGDVCYPLGKKTYSRFARARLQRLDFIKDTFLEAGLWPSSATVARTMVSGRVEVWDADAERRRRWAESGVDVADGDSGWTLLESRAPDPRALWLVDPYDFLAEWRTRLPALLAKSKETSILVYIYNRSAKNAEAFADYRAFKNALADGRDLPSPLGRVAADGFLPRAHHEMLYLPSRAECENPAFPSLLRTLEEETANVTAALGRATAFDV